MADPVELTVVQVRADDRWQAVAVIDGRRYPDRESYDRVVWAAFATMNEQEIPAQFETREVMADEQPWPLPSWEDYWATKGTGSSA